MEGQREVAGGHEGGGGDEEGSQEVALQVGGESGQHWKMQEPLQPLLHRHPWALYPEEREAEATACLTTKKVEGLEVVAGHPSSETVGVGAQQEGAGCQEVDQEGEGVAPLWQWLAGGRKVEGDQRAMVADPVGEVALAPLIGLKEERDQGVEGVSWGQVGSGNQEPSQPPRQQPKQSLLSCPWEQRRWGSAPGASIVSPQGACWLTVRHPPPCSFSGPPPPFSS